METPPGTVWLRDSLFIDKHEIANFDYRQFVDWIKRKNPVQYQMVLPDTQCWNFRGVDGAPYVNLYFRGFNFQEYPVVGISYAQALLYCEWRTKRVNEMMYIRDNNLKWNPDSTYSNVPKKVKYRLPSKEEWLFAARAGLNNAFTYPFGYETMFWKSNTPVSPTLESYYLNYFTGFNSVAANISGVFKGKPNRYGIYHMLGNVSELVSDSLVMGLNYVTDLRGDSFIPYIIYDEAIKAKDAFTGYSLNSFLPYVEPYPWLGFRCVCEVLP